MPVRVLPPSDHGTGSYESPPCPFCPGKITNLCRPFERQLQAEFFQIATRQRWTRHELLFRAGDRLSPVFKVTSGMVAVSRTMPTGQRQILRFVLPGDVCSDLSTEGRNTFDGEAITEEVITCGFDRDGFDAFVARDPAAGEAVRRELSARLVETGFRLAAIGRLAATPRVADFLCEMQAAFEARGLQSLSLELPMTQTDIGDYLGMRIETVNRALTKLRQRRLIKPRGGKVVIVDLAELTVVAGRRMTARAVPPAGRKAAV